MDELEEIAILQEKLCSSCRAAHETEGNDICAGCAVDIAKREIRKLQEQKKKQAAPAYWIKRMENGWRMWECPRCKGRIRGQFYEKDQNPYHFCPFCGKKLATKAVGYLDRRHDREGG